jgi:hypothetical protein
MIGKNPKVINVSMSFAMPPEGEKEGGLCKFFSERSP